MLVCTYSNPATKGFSDLNAIWYVSRGPLVHNGMSCDLIEGQGHGVLKVMKMADVKSVATSDCPRLRLPYNLHCVGGDVKHCSIQSAPPILPTDRQCARYKFLYCIVLYTVFRKKTPTHIFFHISMSDV